MFKKTWYLYLFVYVVLLGLLYLSFQRIDYQWNWSVIWDYREKLSQGWLMTLKISAVALILSVVWGWVLMLMQRGPALLKSFSLTWVHLMRGTPLLVQILLFFYVIANAAGLDNRFWLSVLILSNFSAAYISEIFRSALESIPKSQWDAARSIGLEPWQTYKEVIGPQLIKIALPALGGQFASIVKDSSLLSIIAVSEFTLNAQEVNSLTYSTLEVYLPLAFGYLLITAPITWFAHRMERRLHYEF
ncbi:MAG: amino acid ABC transporter permease [Bdellovibrionota bacterium]